MEKIVLDKSEDWSKIIEEYQEFTNLKPRGPSSGHEYHVNSTKNTLLPFLIRIKFNEFIRVSKYKIRRFFNKLVIKEITNVDLRQLGWIKIDDFFVFFYTSNIILDETMKDNMYLKNHFFEPTEGTYITISMLGKYQKKFSIQKYFKNKKELKTLMKYLDLL